MKKKFVLSLAVSIIFASTFLVFGNLLVKAQKFEATLMPPKIYLGLDRGESITKKVEIRNDSDGPVTFYIQKSDLEAEDVTGSPIFTDKEPGSSYSLSEWMSFDINKLELAKGETGEVNVTISVPRNAESGGHYGAVWFSTLPPDIEGESGVGVGANFVSQVFVEISGDVVRSAGIAEFKTDKKFYANLPIEFSSLITNDGNTHFVPQGRIRIRNRITKKEYNVQYNSALSAVLPGLKREFKTTWEEPEDNKELFPKFGLYDAELRLAGADFARPNNVRISFWIIPPRLVIGILAVILGLILIMKAYGAYAVKKSKRKK